MSHALEQALATFYAIDEGHLGYEPTDFQQVFFDDENQIPPPIYNLHGHPETPFGRVHATELAKRNRIRLVRLNFFLPVSTQRYAYAYAWQGEHAFHLLTPMVEEQSALGTAVIDEIEASYAHHYRDQDFYLDVELRV